jgi:hypothetical protein
LQQLLSRIYIPRNSIPCVLLYIHYQSCNFVQFVTYRRSLGCSSNSFVIKKWVSEALWNYLQNTFNPKP